MHQAKIIRPMYSERFRCIDSACEDTCCQGWTVPVDLVTIKKYEGLPASPLAMLINANILLAPDREDGSKPATFASIRMTASNSCPLLSEDHLCRIHAEYGEAFLPSTCGTYPRIVHSIGDREEKALALSCPEAARVVLLNPALLSPSDETVTEPLYSQIGGGSGEDARSLQPWFWSIREFVVALIQNRAYPLWQRLFLLGVFCRQLEAVTAGEREGSLPAFLRDFQAAVASGSPRTAMDTLPIDRSQQLDVVLRLAGMMLDRSNLTPRFVECVEAFTTGIGHGHGATMESLTNSYTVAHDWFYAPFFDRHPHILENYLINTIFRCQFPFGREGLRPGASPSMSREYATLTAQFALMKGLLIGVAGRHREAFSTDHVVHTFQVAAKHFEHHIEFLDGAHALLVESQMDGLRGAAILLRNAETIAPAIGVPALPPSHATVMPLPSPANIIPSFPY